MCSFVFIVDGIHETNGSIPLIPIVIDLVAKSKNRYILKEEGFVSRCEALLFYVYKGSIIKSTEWITKATSSLMAV